MPEYSDKEIIDNFLNNSDKNEAFLLLVKKYQQQVYWLIRRLIINHDDTDDLVQNVFIKIYQNLHTFRQESELYTWIYRIATNEALNHLKKFKRKWTLSIDNQPQSLVKRLESDIYFDGDEIKKKLHKAILKLPEKQRVVFNMRYFNEIPYEKMAVILKTSEGALKADFHHAVKKIEKFLLQD